MGRETLKKTLKIPASLRLCVIMRIERMMNRPIPKSARIFIIAMPVILVLSFVLLPTARSGDTGKKRCSTGLSPDRLQANRQAALQMLIRADRALDFKHDEIHEAAMYGLDALLGVQFANGAFPQGFRGPSESQPVLKARYPDFDWRTEGKIKSYWACYTLNDNVAGTVADALIDAHRVYGTEKYKAALEKLGDFLILSQMPEPQPGWCQQYNYETVPIWARKFEPPAITGWESQDVMETLIKIAQYTGNKKYLEPIPRALKYFKKSLLPDGSIARYYEFKTNKPLYMDARYQLTYDDSAAPSHYGWKHPARLDSIQRAYENAKRGVRPETAPSAADLEAEVRTIIRELDSEGRWITKHAGERLVGQPEFPNGFNYISSDVFSRNVETLSRYIAATQ